MNQTCSCLQETIFLGNIFINKFHDFKTKVCSKRFVGGIYVEIFSGFVQRVMETSCSMMSRRQLSSTWIGDFHCQTTRCTWDPFRMGVLKSAGFRSSISTIPLVEKMDVGGLSKPFLKTFLEKGLSKKKSVCFDDPADYPSNQQFEVHFMEFLANGYKPAMGSVDIRFDHGSGDRTLKLHDVKFVDGQTKVLLMLGIVAFCVELELTAKDCDHPQLQMVLSSFVAVRCTYTFFENESDHYLHSLRRWIWNSHQLVFCNVCLFVMGPLDCFVSLGVYEKQHAKNLGTLRRRSRPLPP